MWLRKSILVKSKVKYFIWYRTVFTVLKSFWLLRSIQVRLYFPVDLTGNMIMIEKLNLSGTWTGDLPSLTSQLLRHQAMLDYPVDYGDT